MALTLASHANQARHYAAVRQRLWPSRRKFVAPRVTRPSGGIEDRIAFALHAIDALPEVTAPAIIREVAFAFDVQVRWITGRGRTPDVAVPRLIAMAVCRIRGGLERKKICPHFNRERTCINNAINRYGPVVEAAMRRAFVADQ